MILLSVFLSLQFWNLVTSFRLYGSEDEDKPFVPYDEGFVGHTSEFLGDNGSGAMVNPGSQEDGKSSARFLADRSGNRFRLCPNMVGPVFDAADGLDKYYCTGIEYGYCDIRSGACFCNEGFQGKACSSCAPTHMMVGMLCQPRKLCPNDCSAAGECNYLTGLCSCHEHRKGADCSVKTCSVFDEHCSICNASACLECIQGYDVDISGSKCFSCSKFDPRCSACDASGCLQCTDLLLTSIRVDVTLLDDEKLRELSIKVPSASLQADAFDEAEAFFLVNNILNVSVPLKDSAVACHQGLNSDDSFVCQPTNISNVVCGHFGVFSFDSPEYEISEGSGSIRIFVRRSGGGVGSASVTYKIEHKSTSPSDASPTAFYTTDQTLTFRNGEISKSFLITIHNDQILVSLSPLCFVAQRLCTPKVPQLLISIFDI